MIGHEQVRAHNNGDCWAPTCPCCEYEANGPATPTCGNCDGDLAAGEIGLCDDCAAPQSAHYDITIPDETELPWTLPDGAA